MHSCFIKYALVVLLLSSFGCSDHDQSENASGNSTIGDDTVSGSHTADPYSLTPADLHDDSVFNDGSKPASWQSAGITDSVKIKQFIRKLQVWVRDNQVDSISACLQYPVRNPGIRDEKDFKLNYGTYISDGVKAALADQKLNQVFRNQQGVMIGQGQIWIREENNHIKIIAINN